MSVFIAWSGRRSHELAVALHGALVEGALVSFLSSSEIEPGDRWFDTVGARVVECRTFIACVTAENRASPWMHFEAGAAWASPTRARLLPILLDAVDVRGALGAFQAVQASSESLGLALRELGVSADALSRLDHAVASIAPLGLEEVVPAVVDAFDRLDGAPAEEDGRGWATFRRRLDVLCASMEAYDDLAGETLAPFARDMWSALRHEIEETWHEMDRLLGTDGADQSWRADCRREVILHLRVARHFAKLVTSPVIRPLVPAHLATRFEIDEPVEARKGLLRQLEADPLSLAEIDPNAAMRSPWVLDRIAGSIIRERGSFVADQVDEVERERENVSAARRPMTLMPLHYAVRALAATLPEDRTEAPVEAIRRVARAVRALLDERAPDLRDIHDNLNRIDAWLAGSSGERIPR
jgi:TIR domain